MALSEIAKAAAIVAAFLAVCGVADAGEVPLPRPRPRVPAWIVPVTFREAAGANFNTAEVTADPTPCDERLAAVAMFAPMPHLIGPEACGGGDMVRLDAVLLSNNTRVGLQPPAVLNCRMAESVAAWLRDDVVPKLATLGSPLRALENYDSYECRSRNRIAGAKLSDHAHGDALDVRSLSLADGRRLELTDAKIDEPLRESLRESACQRFTTVLGPGSDGYHEGHVHLDLIRRHKGYRLCEWDVRESPAAVAEAQVEHVPLPPPRPAEVR